jgi:hypothetical protein
MPKSPVQTYASVDCWCAHRLQRLTDNKLLPAGSEYVAGLQVSDEPPEPADSVFAKRTDEGSCGSGCAAGPGRFACSTTGPGSLAVRRAECTSLATSASVNRVELLTWSLMRVCRSPPESAPRLRDSGAGRGRRAHSNRARCTALRRRSRRSLDNCGAVVRAGCTRLVRRGAYLQTFGWPTVLMSAST